jgi:ribose transport system substrate-binding protein
VLFVLLAAAQGCHSSAASREITAIPLFSTWSVAYCERAGLREAIAGTPLRLEFNGPSDGNAQRQIDLVSDAVKRRVYGIVLEPRSLYAANDVIRTALRNAIPVVVLLHPIPLAPAEHLSFVLEDGKASAQLIAQRIQHIAPHGARIMILGVDSLMAGGRERFADVEEAIHAESPASVIVRRVVRAPNIPEFSRALDEAMDEQPNVDIVVSLVSHASYAAASVLHRRRTFAKIHLIAVDQNAETLYALRLGEVDSVVVQDLRQMAHVAIQNIEQDRGHEPVAPVTAVKPILVTRENIDSEAVQRVLLMNWVEP